MEKIPAACYVLLTGRSCTSAPQLLHGRSVRKVPRIDENRGRLRLAKPNEPNEPLSFKDLDFWRGAVRHLCAGSGVEVRGRVAGTIALAEAMKNAPLGDVSRVLVVPEFWRSSGYGRAGPSLPRARGSRPLHRHRARRAGPLLVCAPRCTRTALRADAYVRFRQGTTVVLIPGRRFEGVERIPAAGRRRARSGYCSDPQLGGPFRAAMEERDRTCR